MSKFLNYSLLTAILVLSFSLTAFAADPPTITSPFTDPVPSLTPSEDKKTDPIPSLTPKTDNTTNTATNSSSSSNGSNGSTSSNTSSKTNTYTTQKGSTSSTNPKTQITKSGPEAAFLILPSLALGYLYNRKRK